MKKFNENDEVTQKVSEESIIKAYNNTLKKFSNEEIFLILNSDEDDIKPIAILEIQNISNSNEAQLLINHLTGCDGRIREAAAIKIVEVFNDFLLKADFIDILVNGICDINPNVPRSLTELIKTNKSAGDAIYHPLIKRIKGLLSEFKKYEKEFGAFKDNKMKNKKNHAKNKKLFNLYWCLEALSEIEFQPDDEIFSILNECSGFCDYPIREKASKILSKFDKAPFELLQKLKNDENFYVKKHLYAKIAE